MNKVILMGRLTRDPEIRYAQDNSLPVARFTLAVDRRFKRDNSQQTADFISCVAFGKTAEVVEKYTAKGSKILVQGRIQTGSYEKNGQKVHTTDVMVDRVEVRDSKAEAPKKEEKPVAPVNKLMSVAVPSPLGNVSVPTPSFRPAEPAPIKPADRPIPASPFAAAPAVASVIPSKNKRCFCSPVSAPTSPFLKNAKATRY